MRRKVWTYNVTCCWLRPNRGCYYEAHFLASTIGPYVGQQYNAISRTLPGAISKLANILRHGNIGRLHPGCERSDAIMGLNR